MSKLKKIIEDIEIENIKINYNKNKKLFNIISDFIIKKKIILYGGYALNLILPNKKKFYKNYTQSDYDCYSYNALKDAFELVNILKKKKYKFIKIKKAQHEKTFKIYVGTINIIDLSQIKKKIYKIFLKLHNNEKKLLNYNEKYILIPFSLLKRNLHYELSRPEGSSYRWEKIDKRLKIINSVFLNKNKNIEKKFTKIPNSVLECKKMLLKYIKKNKTPIIDMYAIKILKNIKNIDCCRYYNNIYILQILSVNYKKNVENIIDIVKKTINQNKYKIIIIRKTSTSSYVDILKKRTRIQLIDIDNNIFINLITIIKVEDNCYSIQNKNGFNIGSYDTILCFLYSYYISYLIASQITERKKSDAISNVKDSIIFYENIIKKINIKERYIKNCYGKELLYEEIYKKNWLKKLSILRI